MECDKRLLMHIDLPMADGTTNALLAIRPQTIRLNYFLSLQLFWDISSKENKNCLIPHLSQATRLGVH